MENCVFCEIINRKILGLIVDEDKDLIVFISLENHPLIVPKKHFPDIFTLDNEIAEKIMKKSIRISKATKDALGCDGIYITQTNGKAAGQDVFHYHLHVYPKWNDKRSLGVDFESKQNVMEQIKKILSLSDLTSNESL